MGDMWFRVPGIRIADGHRSAVLKKVDPGHAQTTSGLANHR